MTIEKVWLLFISTVCLPKDSFMTVHGRPRHDPRSPTTIVAFHFGTFTQPYNLYNIGTLVRRESWWEMPGIVPCLKMIVGSLTQSVSAPEHRNNDNHHKECAILSLLHNKYIHKCSRLCCLPLTCAVQQP
jgi:hypothetical protein